ncbi:hypothetical protein TWF102_009939 [Orbilia oligospora]|uniref:PH domain-containing protein n=1 Tax=Orbilia oligospora TaxID=2813651 RepID=A0A7C8NH72_ORBOL|nr:hypothetical protein TWF706_005102 [Orbilia oligospora]KAF3103232.1 hypothetical protein TWF103_007233 [Orbilia oligospora]KAF3109167.1 hypothetical protein TWF102_009939 [Orbilia oligospora]
MGEPTSMTKRARAFSATFFNRDRTTSSNSSPGPASPTKPLGAESFPSNSTSHSTPPNDSPAPVARRTSRSGQPRPSSVINPFAMSSGIGGNGIQEADILPEMVGVFKYLGEHAQKVYHEGYFQKLNDMNPDGTAVISREWTDCYAQLIGTVLTIWDDRAIQEEEERARRGFPPEGGAVKPTFLNLTDASMKMIDSLPQRAGGTPLQNVLSLSTAGRNRYLLHFASVPELTQWTAAIRLAMFEHNCLQEAYTGALIAAKGRSLNSIGTILERSKFKIEDWTRVRFGAGTPWKRYWAVITPPDEKSFQKAKKVAKKASKQAGAQIQMEAIIGDIKFYENSKVKKKTIPVATISGAFAAYAVYPEAKALIDQSTLVKIEGNIVIHSDPPFTSEGIVFMMPDHHAAVTGFEMMLRFLIPTYDVFNLYGRPNRLAADSIDPRSLMFAFPREPRQPYRLLDLADVVGVINENGSNGWSEAEWRRKLKQTTSKVQLSGRLQRASLASPSTASLPGQMKIGSAISFDGNTGRSSFNTQRPGLPTIQSYGQQNGEIESHSAPPQLSRQTSHTRSMSEAQAQFYPPQQSGYPDAPQAPPPPPPPPGQAYGNPPAGYISPQNTGYQQPQGSAAPLPQSYTNGYSGPNSRPPSSRSQRSQMSGRSGHGQGPPNQQMGYRQPGPPGGPPSAFRGDPRGPGGFDPNLGNRQPPQLQTANLANTYPMPTASPSTSRGPPVPAHSFSPVANARAMSRLSVGTLEMMHGNNAGPIPVDYHAQAQSPTLGFPAQADGATAQRARSYGSTDTSTDSELSSDSDLAAPRPAYTTQGHKANGSTASITPATGAIASRIPKSNDLHTDPNDFDLSDELRRKQLEAAAAAATRNGGHHAPYGQHPLPPLPPNADQQGYQQGYGGNYANGYDGSAQSNIVHSPLSLLSSPPLPHLHLNTDTSSSSFTSATAAAASTTTTPYGITNQISPRTDGTGEISATTFITPQILGGNTNPSSNSNVTTKNPNDDDDNGVVVVTTVVVNEEKTSNTSTPVSADGVADRISRIDSEVFNRISSLGGGKGIHKSNSVISRKPVGSGVGRMNSVMSRGSVYSVRTGSLSSVSNYSSAVQSPVEDVKLRKKDFFGNSKDGGDDDDGMPKRYGVKKFVGQPTEDMLEVVIGETKYAVTKVKGMDDDDRPISGDWGSGSGSGSSPRKPGSRPATSGGELQEPESTVVFLGHGRGMSVGGVEVDFGPTADLGGKLGPKEKNVVRRKPAHDRNSSRDSDLSGVGKRRSVAWAPGMVNFNTNAVRNVDSNASEVGSLGATGTATTGNANVGKLLNTHKGKQREDEKEEEMEKEKKEEFDAHSYVGAHYELAQQTTDVMRNKLLNQHHQRSGSLGTGQFFSYFNVGRRKSKTPSDEGEQQPGSGNGGNTTGATGTVNRPALHSRTNSVSAEQLRRISRAGSSADLLHGTGGGGSTGSNSPNLASRPQSRSANRELATTAPSRPQSQGNLLSRPASRGPSALMNTNNPSTSALPLHSLPPPMVSPIPPSSYHPPQVTPTASIYHPPPHLQSGPSTPSYGVTDHYSNYRQRERGDSGAPDGRLSAGEQEYIARSTGTPLLGQNWNSETSKIGKAPPHKAGLLGQMEKREKEKKDFKERTNRNSWAVQHAMRQRQSIVGMGSLMQQQAQQEAQKQAQQQQLQAQQQQYQYQYQQQQQQQQQYQYQQQQLQQLQQQTGMGVGFGNSGQHMGQPIQQHYGFYGHQQPQQQPQQQQQQNAATIAAWNAQQQQQIMIMQQQIALAQAQQQQMAERRGSWRYG